MFYDITDDISAEPGGISDVSSAAAVDGDESFSNETTSQLRYQRSTENFCKLMNLFTVDVLFTMPEPFCVSSQFLTDQCVYNALTLPTWVIRFKLLNINI
jgi:hypothetical protein